MGKAFDDWQDKAETEISPSLLWEYDLNNFDWEKNQIIVVQRVIERGWKKDVYAAIRKYGGKENFIEILKKVPYFNDRDLNYVSIVFDIDLNDLQCYKNKQRRQRLLNS